MFAWFPAQISKTVNMMQKYACDHVAWGGKEHFLDLIKVTLSVDFEFHQKGDYPVSLIQSYEL